MTRLKLVLSSIVCDLVVGDPRGWPHPVQIIGTAIDRAESFAREQIDQSPRMELLAGACVTGVILGLSCCAGALFERNALTAIAAGGSTLALRSLIAAVADVADALDAGDILGARRCLARIVGRDTASLDEADISRAAIETLAESLCDGVVAPLLFLSVGGVRAALGYKAINTLDSMIGHIEAPYRYFGRFAARLDDLANVIPARISALALVVAAEISSRRGQIALRTMLRDARAHRSPNAGQAEAAMAGALGVRLGGTNSYGGVATPAAYLGGEFARAGRRDIRSAMKLAMLATTLIYGAAIVACSLADSRNQHSNLGQK